MTFASKLARRVGDAKWFLLGLCFLALNGWGVWRLTTAPRICAPDGTDRRVACVARFAPGNGSEVAHRQPLVWTFTRDMVTTNETDAQASGAPPATLRPPMRGDFRWLSPRELTFVPVDDWPLCQEFEAKVDDHLAPLDGTPLTGGRTFRFHAEPLRLLSVSLASYDDGAATAVLKLGFNAPPASAHLPRTVALARAAPRPGPVGWERVGDVSSRDVLVRTATVAPGEQLTVSVDAGLPPATGSLGTTCKQQQTVAIDSDFEVGSIIPESPTFQPCQAQVAFGREVDLREAAACIEVQPAVKFDVTPSGGYGARTGCTLAGAFQPGTEYTITFKKGLAAADGAKLVADVARHVVFPDRDRALSVAVDGHYLSPLGALNVPVVAMNVRRCNLALRRICPGNVVFFANGSRRYGYDRYGNSARMLSAPPVTRKVAFPDTPNRENKFYVNLRELAGAEPVGVYEISVGYQGRYGYETDEESLVVVTDLGISAKVARDGVLAWVNALRTAQPVAGAEVVLHARNNQELARGRTDAQGLVFLPCQTDCPEELRPSLVTAAQTGDLSYLQLADGDVALDGSAGDPYLADGCEAFVFTDRGVYRPGETLRAEALVRDAHLAPPASFPVLFRVLRPDGKVFRDFPATLNSRGAAELATELPSYLPTGRYGVRLVMPGTFTLLGAATVSLEEFVPPQIAVSLAKLPERQPVGEGFKLAASARHLFGRPAAGLPAAGSVCLQDAPFSPTNWNGYSFGDAEKASIKHTVALGEQPLDADGATVFTFAPPGKLQPAAVLKATVCVTVRDSGGRGVSAYGSALLDAYPFYVGLKPAKEGGHVKTGETLDIAVVTVKPDGQAVQPDAPLLATVERVEWTSVMRRDDGRYAWQSERTKTRVGEPRQVVLKDGAGTFAFTAERAGEYLVTLADPFRGATTSLRLFAAAADATWVDWARDRPAQVQLSLDRPHYAPGEKARLAVKAPFGGTALLTVESDRVLERRVVQLAANTAEFEIEVKPGYAPNVHCVLSVIRPAVAESVWSAHRAIGSTVLKVVPPGHALTVAVDSPKTIRPQSRLSARVRVADETGQPAAGVELAVLAVDEGICMLTDFPTPDPLAHFLRTRGLGVTCSDLYSELMPVCEDTADATVSHVAGDGSATLGRRLNPVRARRFRTVALWQSGALTDTNGEAAVAFDVPEFTGELRLTAVAFGPSAFGAAKQAVSVKRPLVVQAELPRFLAPDDSCRLSLAIFNETGTAQEAAWRVTCGGPLAAAIPEGKLQLPAGGSGVVPVTLRAAKTPGKALCTVEVTAGAERYVETFELAVRPVLASASRLVCTALKPGAKVELTVPADWLPGTEYYAVQVSGQPDVKLAGGLDWLLRYPYGCCEQTTSSAFPLLYLADLANRVRPNTVAREDTSHYVLAGVYRLLTMQRESGGFAMWPEGRSAAPWASIYAAHFLVEAKKAGCVVPQDRLDAALAYLRQELEKREAAASPQPEDDDGARPQALWLAQRAYACQVLALAGTPEQGWNARLLERASDLSPDGRAHLAAALLASGKPREAKALLGEIGLPAPQDAYAGFGSRARDIALALSAWLDIDPQNELVPRLVRELEGLQVKDGGWWSTTQENAMALLALGKFARLTRADKTPFAGELLPAGQAAVAFQSDRDLHWTSPVPGAVQSLRLANHGPGTCWYSVRTDGVPTTGEAQTYDEGIAIRREFLDPQGRPLDARKLKQGDLAVVRLILDTRGTACQNLVVEDLLPAGWEIENPALATARTLPWVDAKTDWCIHRELRDDRVLLFTGAVSDKAEYYYTVRAVTPGVFALPPVRVEAMYQPEVRSQNGGGRVEVTE